MAINFIANHEEGAELNILNSDLYPENSSQKLTIWKFEKRTSFQ